MTDFTQSNAWWERAERVIPMGTQTLSKSPTQFVQGVTPIYLRRGQGAHLFDVDGHEYIDYPMALGPMILGYCEPVVDEAIRRQLDDGITFTLMHPLEVEVAERIVEMCPGVEAVRFGKSGSDALSAAVRAARAITGRNHVLVSGYHGWHDWFIGTTTRNRGVPDEVQKLTSTFAFNDLASLETALALHSGDVAAVIVEPSGATVPSSGYLQDLVDLTRRHHAVSIFDEVITGFRLAPGGARERYGAIPDISCYGKALGNGMPISAIGASWEIMRIFEEIFFSGTHGGETLSLAAAKAVLDTLADGSVLQAIEDLGSAMLTGVQQLIVDHGVGHRVNVGGEPQRAVVGFSGADHLVVKSFVQQTLAEHGALFNGSMFICSRHTQSDVDRTLAAFDEAFTHLEDDADVGDRLRGAAVQPVFRTP